jgi:hypothetical protein
MGAQSKFIYRFVRSFEQKNLQEGQVHYIALKIVCLNIQ